MTGLLVKNCAAIRWINFIFFFFFLVSKLEEIMSFPSMHSKPEASWEGKLIPL